VLGDKLGLCDGLRDGEILLEGDALGDNEGDRLGDSEGDNDGLILEDGELLDLRKDSDLMKLTRLCLEINLDCVMD